MRPLKPAASAIASVRVPFAAFVLFTVGTTPLVPFAVPWNVSCAGFHCTSTVVDPSLVVALRMSAKIDTVSVVSVRHSKRSMLLTSAGARSEEHTSELQSHHDLVCRLLLEKKK